MKIDKHLLISILILLLILCFLVFAIKFLYQITKLATTADQAKIKSEVVQFDMESYQKLDKRFKIE